jgi:hypothetical protein
MIAFETANIEAAGVAQGDQQVDNPTRLLPAVDIVADK